MRVKIILILLFTIQAITRTQPLPEFLTIDQGLSQNYIFDALQDSRGFLWFGTKEGLNRFDGYSVVVYRNNPFDSTTLSSNNVTVIFEDQQQTLWVGTNGGGLNKFDRQQETFHRFQFPRTRNNELTHNHILSISQGSNGTLWIGTYDGAFLFDCATETFRDHFSDSLVFPLLPHSEVNDVLDDRDSIWFGTNTGLAVMDKKLSVIHTFANNDREEARNTTVNFVFKDSDSRIFVGKRKGLYRLDNNTFHSVFTANDSNKMFWSMRMKEGKNGDFWLLTAKTLVNISHNLKNISPQASLSTERFTKGLIIDRSGVVWSGTSGFGVLITKPRTQQFGKHKGNFLSELFGPEIQQCETYFRKNNIVSTINLTFRGTNFYSVTEDSNGRVWLLTEVGLFSIDNALHSLKFYKTNPVGHGHEERWLTNLVYVSRKNNIWITTVGGISTLNRNNGTFSYIRLYPDTAISSSMLNKTFYNDITVLYQDKFGILWCGTPELGLIRYNEQDGSIRYYSHKPNKKGTLLNNHVLTIHEDPFQSDSILWIGTEGGGLNRFNTRTETFTYFTKTNGLPNDVIYSILEDEKKNFWMSTNFGLVKFNPATFEVHSYDVEDGLQSNEFNRNEYYKTKNGKMYFGGIYGYNAFYPSAILLNTVPPQIAITDFQLYNKIKLQSNTGLKKSILETDTLVLDYSQNMFSLQFAALDYNVPKKNTYRYMLEGFNNSWITANPSRTATYTNLDPGSYTFKVIASNSDGVWNNRGKSLSIIVLPPFWMTWWFRGTLIFLFLSLGPTVYFIRVTQLKREQKRQQEVSMLLIESQEQERKRIAHEMHDSLGQELLIIKNRAIIGLKTAVDGTKVQEQLQKISDSSSETLKLVRNISHVLHPPELERLGLSETLRSILSKIQDAASYHVHGEVDEIDGLLLKENEINLVRIIQEAFNNIEKHAHATDVTITVRRNGNQLLINISDDGVGFSLKSVRHGIGLAGITERVRILHGTIVVDSVEQKGTSLSIQIPLP